MLVAMLTNPLSVKTHETKIKSRNFASGVATIALLAASCSGGFAQQARTATSCAQLAKLDLPEATITVAAVVQPMAFKLPPTTMGPGGPGGPGGGPPGGGAGMALVPFDPKDTTNHAPFCRVAATLSPSGDSNIKIEVWMPLSGWNGKLWGRETSGGVAPLCTVDCCWGWNAVLPL
jgi:feruloyl esterase